MRIAKAIEPQERTTALLIERLAEAIQQACYYSEYPLAPATAKALHKAYRVLKPAVVFYRGEGEHALCWDPPDYRFRPKEAK